MYALYLMLHLFQSIAANLVQVQDTAHAQLGINLSEERNSI